MKSIIRLLVMLMVISGSTKVLAQEKIWPADSVMAVAYQKAANENKQVFLIFHASWCGWCKKMDASINDSLCKDLFYNNFVIAHLTVEESKGKEHLENPGGRELKARFLGQDQGLPYWVILDKTEKILADSQLREILPNGQVRSQNMGCPASEEEVAAFIGILKSTTDLSASQLAVIAKRFRQNEQVVQH